MNEKIEQLLGIGSIIDVDDMDALPDTKYMIFARGIRRDESGTLIFRYRVTPHPFGNIPSQEEHFLTVEEDKVLNVHHEGYKDDEDVHFIEGLVAKLDGLIKQQKSALQDQVESKTIPSTPEPAVQDLEREEENRIQERLKKDSFYKFRK